MIPLQTKFQCASDTRLRPHRAKNEWPSRRIRHPQRSASSIPPQNHRENLGSARVFTRVRRRGHSKYLKKWTKSPQRSKKGKKSGQPEQAQQCRSHNQIIRWARQRARDFVNEVRRMPKWWSGQRDIMGLTPT